MQNLMDLNGFSFWKSTKIMTQPTFIIWSFITAGPTNKRTAPKTTVRVPATINPIATLALLMAMIANMISVGW